MTIFMWRILGVAAAALFVFSVLTLWLARFLKNKYAQAYTKDTVLRKVKATNSRNTIYLTSGETYKYIKKYVVCKSGTDQYVICNFARRFQRIGFYIVQYTLRKRVCAVIRVQETNTTLSSRVVALSKRCAHVNVVVAYADDAEINTEFIRPIARYKIRLYAFFKSIAVFTALFLLRHAALELFGGIYKKAFLNSFWDYALIGVSFLVALFGYAITVLCFRGKNAKEANGGAIEYEFI